MKESREDNSAQENQAAVTTRKSNIKPENTTTFANIFKYCTDYDLENFTNYRSFTQWLHRPADASALGVFRMLYG